MRMLIEQNSFHVAKTLGIIWQVQCREFGAGRTAGMLNRGEPLRLATQRREPPNEYKT